MTDIVERAKSALEGTTEGPWTFQHWGGQNQNGDYAESILFDGDGESMTYGLAVCDGDFIAQARTLVPELVAEVERLRGQVQQMRRQTELFMEDGDRNRLTVALAVSDE